MHRLLILIITLFYFTPGMAQNEIYIPYRSGKLWGIADYEGKMIIEPRYDSIVTDNDYNFVLLKTFKKGKQGLIINGREVLANNYYEIEQVDEMYLTAVDTAGVIILDIYGNPINTKPASTIKCYQLTSGGGKTLIFHILNHDSREDLLAWDLDKRQMHYLFQDYASIKFKGRPYLDISKLDLLFKKNEADLLKEEAYTLENFKLKKIVPKVKNEAIKEKSNDDAYALYEPGLTNMSSGTGKPLRETTNETVKKGPVIFLSQYWLRNDSVFLNMHGLRHVKEMTTQSVTLPEQATNIKLNSYRGYIDVPQNEDTSIRYSDYITFDLKEKKALRTMTNEVLLFDDLVAVFYLNRQTGNNDVAFLGGNCAPGSGKMKYGMWNARMQPVFPISFDTIIVNTNPDYNDFNYWTVVSNDRFGIIHPNGTVITEPVYDSITNRITGKSQGDFLAIKDKNKYGVFKGAQGTQSLFVKPVFDYPVKYVYLKYPFVRYHQSGFYEKEFGNKREKVNIALEDKHKKRLGYANAEGRLYFND